MTASTRTEPTAERIRAEIDRTIQRTIKGLDFVTSPAPPVGLTPKDIILKQGTLNLYHYRPMADEIYRVPLLLIMATTNRGYIFDLAPGQSLVEFLLKRGYDVYVIDWSAPGPEEKTLRLEDYTQRFIPACVRRVQEASGEPDITMAGYCMGGVLSVIYAALHPRGPIKNLVCFTTPINFEPMTLFKNWADKRFFEVDRLVEAVGNVPADLIQTSFDMLRPATRVATQVQLWEKMWDDQFVTSYRRFERWTTDTLPLAGEYFKQTVKEFFWENSLYEGRLVVGGKKALLRNIKVPTLHAMAEHDHIVPLDAAKPLIEQVRSADKEEVILKGGHVSLVAGPNAVKRLWPKLDSWLGERSL